ncbi:hypothetical protein VNO77_11832 [Canavalia gladiata]|uniref:Uncharacterized protein n=1 Tax=Canavalia gladiata TaxID=3824 RepID=A0AAN9M0W5_CANGL
MPFKFCHVALDLIFAISFEFFYIPINLFPSNIAYLLINVDRARFLKNININKVINSCLFPLDFFSIARVFLEQINI